MSVYDTRRVETPVLLLDRGTAPVYSLAWASGGERLAAGLGDSTVRILSTSGSTRSACWPLCFSCASLVLLTALRPRIFPQRRLVRALRLREICCMDASIWLAQCKLGQKRAGMETVKYRRTLITVKSQTVPPLRPFSCEDAFPQVVSRYESA